MTAYRCFLFRWTLEAYLITIDDIVVTQTPNRAASHDLYAKALAEIDQA